MQKYTKDDQIILTLEMSHFLVRLFKIDITSCSEHYERSISVDSSLSLLIILEMWIQVIGAVFNKR